MDMGCVGAGLQCGAAGLHLRRRTPAARTPTTLRRSSSPPREGRRGRRGHLSLLRLRRRGPTLRAGYDIRHGLIGAGVTCLARLRAQPPRRRAHAARPARLPVLMRRRFWIPTALLALGLVFYFAVYGFRFAGVLLFLAAGVVLAFGIVDALRGQFPRFSRWATRIGLISSASASCWPPERPDGSSPPGAAPANPRRSGVVVLGAGVNGTVPRSGPARGSSRRRRTILRAIRRPLPSFPARRETAKPSRRRSACMTG